MLRAAFNSNKEKICSKKYHRIYHLKQDFFKKRTGGKINGISTISAKILDCTTVNSILLGQTVPEILAFYFKHIAMFQLPNFMGMVLVATLILLLLSVLP